MKRVIDVSLGRVKFSLEEDAYTNLKEYLKRFESTITNVDERKEIMEDIELRVAEIFHKEQAFPNQVIDVPKIDIVIEHLGEVEAMEEPIEEKKENESTNNANTDEGYTAGQRKLYRSADDSMVAGVCGGLAVFLGIDSTIIRIALILLVVAAGTGVLAYLIFWIATKKAETVTQKLELEGYAPTAENIKKYTASHK